MSTAYRQPLGERKTMGGKSMSVMNTDRFLTRVFDKQEKRMLYQDDTFFYLDKEYSYAALNENNIIVYRWTDSTDHPDDSKVHFIPFGDRYIPMQCMGRKNKDNKLFYQHDIIKTHDNCLCTVEINENMSSFDFQLIGDENHRFCCAPLIVASAELLGNKWEHPEILEKVFGGKTYE